MPVANPGRMLRTSESVTEGHPDKVSDQISDAVLDGILEKDPEARVACETYITRGLVIVGGEMSRMPKMNDGFGGQPPGRDHWSSAISLVLGGGGVKGGRIVGKTDPRGEMVVERPVSVQDLHATIYHVLGIDPSLSFLNTAGRPVSLVDDGAPIRELF